MIYDILIVGGGPAGLAFARALNGAGLRIAVVERQPAGLLASPPVDGREIALTHRSVATLTRLGAWVHLGPEDRGGDIASSLLLRRFEAAHRLASRPLYAATNLLVGLYTDERSAARIARRATLRAGARLPMVRQTISRLLMQH